MNTDTLTDWMYEYEARHRRQPERIILPSTLLRPLKNQCVPERTYRVSESTQQWLWDDTADVQFRGVDVYVGESGPALQGKHATEFRVDDHLITYKGSETIALLGIIEACDHILGRGIEVLYLPVMLYKLMFGEKPSVLPVALFGDSFAIELLQPPRKQAKVSEDGVLEVHTVRVPMEVRIEPNRLGFGCEVAGERYSLFHIHSKLVKLHKAGKLTLTTLPQITPLAKEVVREVEQAKDWPLGTYADPDAPLMGNSFLSGALAGTWRSELIARHGASYYTDFFASDKRKETQRRDMVRAILQHSFTLTSSANEPPTLSACVGDNTYSVPLSGMTVPEAFTYLANLATAKYPTSAQVVSSDALRSEWDCAIRMYSHNRLCAAFGVPADLLKPDEGGPDSLDCDHPYDQPDTNCGFCRARISMKAQAQAPSIYLDGTQDEQLASHGIAGEFMQDMLQGVTGAIMQSKPWIHNIGTLNPPAPVSPPTPAQTCPKCNAGIENREDRHCDLCGAYWPDKAARLAPPRCPTATFPDDDAGFQAAVKCGKVWVEAVIVADPDTPLRGFYIHRHPQFEGPDVLALMEFNQGEEIMRNAEAGGYLQALYIYDGRWVREPGI